MELEEKLYQACKREEAEEILLWGSLPEDLIDLIKPEDLINILTYTPEEGLHESTVICFKEVEKFARGRKKYRIKDINVILGV